MRPKHYRLAGDEIPGAYCPFVELHLDRLRVAYLTPTLELAIRESGAARLEAVAPGSRTELWAGEIWDPETEDVELLELLRWVEDDAFAALPGTIGDGPITQTVLAFTATERHEVRIADGAALPPLLARITERLDAMVDRAREGRYVRRALNPKTHAVSGQIG